MRKGTLIFSLALLGLSSFGVFSATEGTKKHHQTDHLRYTENKSHFVVHSADENYSLGVKALLQEEVEITKAKDKDAKLNFYLPRARLKFFGNAFNRHISYLFQAAFEPQILRVERSAIALNAASLQDFYINAAIFPRHFHVRAGKFQIPFTRNYLIPLAQVRFPLFNLAGKAFLPQRLHDVGVMFHSGFEYPLEWAFAAVSDSLSARVAYNHKGKDSFELVDFAGGDFRWSVAASGYTKTDYQTHIFKKFAGSVDFLAKYRRFGGHAEFYAGQADKKNSFGLNADGGYLIQHQWEPGAHYSWVKQTKNLHEIYGQLAYYIHGHHLKLQGFGGAEFENKDFSQFKVGAQLQFAL